MYCKHCGTKTVDGALYCQMDGSALLPLSEVFQLKKDATILFAVIVVVRIVRKISIVYLAEHHWIK